MARRDERRIPIGDRVPNAPGDTREVKPAGESAADEPHAGGCCGGSHGDACCSDDVSGAAGAGADPTQAKISQLEKELADSKDARLRALADFQNYQRRSLENEVRERGAGISSVVRQVIPVIDHFDLALGPASNPQAMTAEKAVEGIRLLRGELVKALEKAGVQLVEPKVGDPFDPKQHEAIMRKPADGVDVDQVSMVFQPGYRLGETLLRPAKVAVAP